MRFLKITVAARIDADGRVRKPDLLDTAGKKADSSPMLLKLLRALWRERSREIRKDFDRSVPFGDTIVDRWEKARMLGFGEGTSIYDNVLVLGDVKVGKNTWIGPNAILDGSGGGLETGDTCSIGPSVQIYTHDSSRWAVSGGKATYEKAPTRIGSHCFIGPGSMVVMGTTIGDGAVVRGMTFVNRDIPAGAIAAGNPMKIIPDGVRRLRLAVTSPAPGA